MSDNSTDIDQTATTLVGCDLPSSSFEEKCTTLEAQIANFENERKYLNDQISELTFSLEIANNRWVDQVNENMRLMVKLKKNNIAF